MARRSIFPLGRDGFTLPEMMAACSIFVGLALLLSRIFGTIATTNDLSGRHIEVMRQAIGAIQRISLDLQNRAATGNLTPFVLKDADGAGNDALLLVSSAPGSTGAAGLRPLSIVRYAILSRPKDSPDFGAWPAIPAFSRQAVTLEWGQNPAAYLPWTAESSREALENAQTQQIAPGIFRCAICFQLWDGQTVAAPPSDWARVRALVIGLAAIDRKGAAFLNTGQRQSLTALFPSPADGQRPLDAWRSSLASLPLPVRQTLRVYEQTISL